MKPGLGLIGLSLIFFLHAALSPAQEDNPGKAEIHQGAPPPEPQTASGKDLPTPNDAVRSAPRGIPHHPRMMPPPDDSFFSNFPEKDRERLKNLAKENPKQFREEIRAYFRAEREREMQVVLRLRMLCLKETDPAKKAQLTEDLKRHVVEKFDRHIKMAERHIAQNEKYLAAMRERLEHSKEDLARRKAAREQIIEKVLKNLLDPDRDPAMPPYPKCPPDKKRKRN